MDPIDLIDPTDPIDPIDPQAVDRPVWSELRSVLRLNLNFMISPDI